MSKASGQLAVRGLLMPMDLSGVRTFRVKASLLIYFVLEITCHITPTQSPTTITYGAAGISNAQLRHILHHTSLVQEVHHNRNQPGPQLNANADQVTTAPRVMAVAVCTTADTTLLARFGGEGPSVKMAFVSPTAGLAVSCMTTLPVTSS